MNDFDLSLLAELEESKPVSLNRVNYGETWIDSVVLVNREAYKTSGKYEKSEFTGQKFDPQQAHIEFCYNVEVTKRDGTTFIKKYFIDKRESGRRLQDKKIWHDQLKPSAVKVFGSEAAFFKAYSNGKRVLCAVEDFDTGRDSKNVDNDGNPYPVTAPKILAKFANEQEMKKDQDKRFKKAEASNGSIPAEIVGQVRGLLKSYSDDVDAVKAELKEDDDFNIYDIDELVKEAQKPPY